MVVAIAIGTAWDARSSKATVIADERRKYETWFANEQSFSFDREKWMHATEAGRQECPWRGLLIAAEQKSSFILMGEKASLMVPKRALDPAALVELRQIALSVRGDGWKFGSRWTDYQATEILLLWRKHWLAMAFGNIAGLVVLGWMARNWLAKEAPPFMIWGWILAAFVVVLLLTAQLWYFPLRFLLRPRHLRETMMVELSDMGVHFATAHKNSFVAWKIVRKFDETGRAFLLWFSPSDYYLLAKQDITRVQQDEIQRILRAKKGTA